IGAAEFEEVRSVLWQESYLLPPYDDRTVYVEFAAVYLERRCFHDDLRHYFPTVEQFGPLDEVLAGDVDADALFAATRLPGAPARERDPAADAGAAEPGVRLEGTPPPLGNPDEARSRRLWAAADRAAARGNRVRAAIRRTRAAWVAGPGRLVDAYAAARDELEHLNRRLATALGLNEAPAAPRQRLPSPPPAPPP